MYPTYAASFVMQELVVLRKSLDWNDYETAVHHLHCDRVFWKVSGIEMMLVGDDAEQEKMLKLQQRIIELLLLHCTAAHVMLASNFPVMYLMTTYQDYWHYWQENLPKDIFLTIAYSTPKQCYSF